ncbi:MAG: hypothetical protein ACW96X_10420, partial [Promethearchaeota archaeon]|jgi:hypothetical protein
MQIFEVFELKEFPYMETREIVEGTTVRDILKPDCINRVFLLVDHDTKRILTYNCPQSSIKKQIYSGILTGKYRQQLRGFYRVYPLNMYSTTDKEFQDIMDKPLGPGRAKPIEKKDFSKPTQGRFNVRESVQNPNMNKAIEYISQFPQPENLVRRFMIIGGQIFTDEETTESFLKEETTVIKPVKLGRLNNGFTLFKDHNYSTRLIIKDRKIQGLELYSSKDDISSPLELKIPVIFEEKFSKPGSIKNLIKAFKIPDVIPEENDKPPQDDSTNQP